MELIEIDELSTVRPFEQIKCRLRDAAEDGRLAANQRLPPVRTFAEQLGVAAGTVARAYRELERDGIFETRGRNGTFVTADARKVISELERAALLKEAADNFAVVGRQVGATKEQLAAAIEQSLSSSPLDK